MNMMKSLLSIVAALLLFACAGQKKMSNSKPEDLYNQTWKLVRMNDAVVDTGRGPFLQFENSKVFGNAGCNRLSGDVTFAENGSIRFGMLVTTKMACPGLSTETEFLEVLRIADHYVVEGNRLSLIKDGKVLAELRS